jgi:hypothetical protein
MILATDPADNVVHEERGEQSGRENDGRQQMMWMQAREDPFRDPVEEAGEPQVRSHEHHGEQQDDRAEVDGCERLGRTDDPERHHEHGADDRGAWAIDFHPREFAEGEYEVAAEENQVRGENVCVGQERGTETNHRLYTLAALRTAHR